MGKGRAPGKPGAARAPAGGGEAFAGGLPAEHEVGARLRARLVALEKRLGLFELQIGYAAESRFRVANIVPREHPVPAGMGALFAGDLAALHRVGTADGERCHREDIGPYRVHCLSFFHYEGFQALVYVEHEGDFLCAWRDVEVERDASPRSIFAGDDSRPVEAFLDHVLGPTHYG